MTGARLILKNMLSLSVAEVAKQGLTVIFTIYVARVLSPEGFGIINFAKAFVMYFILVVGLGYDTYGTREIAKDKSSLQKNVNTIFTIRLILSTLAYIIFLGIVFFLDKPDLVKIVLIIVGTQIFSNAFLLNWVYIGLERMEIVAIRQVAVSILNLLGVILLVHHPDDTIIAVIITSASLAINTIWLIIYYIKEYGVIKLDFDWAYFKQMTKSSIRLGLIFFIITIYNYLNINMLGFMKSNVETGIYSAAFSITLFSLVPSSIFQNAFFPNFSRAELREDRIKIMSKFSLLSYMFGSIIAVGLFTFADGIVIIFGSKYVNVLPVIRIVMVTVLIMYMNINFSSPLIAWKMESKVLYAIIAGGVTNVIANIFLIPRYGAIGAGIGTILSETAVFIGLARTYYLTVRKFEFFKLLVLILLSLTSCGLGYLLYLNGLNIFIAAVLSFIAYFVLIFAFKLITMNELMGYLKR
ncbi:MAG: flippase [Candidatus Kapabacteria bacterium]|nr:flippase [Candidatus Kapabacteria bacterium]